MRVALPTMGEKGLDEKIGTHFGRCPTFTIYDLEDEEIEVIPNNSKHNGGEGNPPELLAEKNIDCMICKNLGKRAVSLFEDLGINVYDGAGGTVEQAIENWKNDSLDETSISEACDEGKHYP